MFAKQTVSYALHGNQRISCKVSKECFFYISDFYCDKEKLVIEVDGEVHNDHLERDIHRDKILQNLGFFVLHIRNAELSDMDLVLSKIRLNFH